ncbi:MAG: cation transporter [Clostridia bacterium]|nr:cation transporter [Clostridia bacterium]
MKTEKKIFIAFFLNLIFSIFELVGGAVTGSVAIVSDAVHDIGDAISIGCSWLLERKSKKQPDDIYTYGYMRFSVAGSLITTVILLLGSAVVIYNAIIRIFNPVTIHYDKMIIFALIGAFVNFLAAVFTKDGDSLNQKAVNLHMLEDVLGWIAVLIGAVVMRFTDFAIIDPILSIVVAVFILINATKNFKQIENLFLEKIPAGIKMEELKKHIREIEGVLDVHHVHVWSIDGNNHYATMHVVTDNQSSELKEEIRRELKEFHIGHATLELECPDEYCSCEHCHVEHVEDCGHHHHHH